MQLISFLRHEAERREQEARGRLERQRISDEVEAEAARKNLLELKVSSMAIENCGQSKAEALSRMEAQKIENDAAVEQAKSKSEAMKIEAVRNLLIDFFFFGIYSIIYHNIKSV